MNEIDTFRYGFEQICSSIALEFPFCSVVAVDLDLKCTSWWTRGTNSPCGLNVYNLTTLVGYSQLFFFFFFYSILKNYKKIMVLFSIEALSSIL